MICLDKKTARQKGLAARAGFSGKEREEASAVIAEEVMRQCRGAASVGIYVSVREEADTRRIIARLLAGNITVAVPRTLEKTLEFRVIRSFDELVPGVWGIPEPVSGRIVSPDKIEVMIVPLSAFDERCQRTGYGRGYYDSVLSEKQKKIGIAFACQQTDLIETDPWDVSLDMVITEKGILQRQEDMA